MKRTAAVALVAVLCSLAAVGAAPGTGLSQPATAAPPGADAGACTGPVERPADAETVVLAQGLQVIGDRYVKRPARLTGYDGEARPAWSHDLGDRGRFLARTVEATDRGLLVVSSERTHSVVELLGGNRRPIWALRFGLGDGPRGDVDARDAILEASGLLVADDDRLIRYDREADAVVERWPLPDDAFVDDESHVSGIARADDGYLVTVAGNGTGSLLSIDDAGGVRWRVDGLREPHSPQQLNGTVLLAEMAGDRVVEVDRRGDVVWQLRGFDRPRSAERLPGGTTLVADRRAHRVLEVTPDGRVVWTAFAPWEPVDATRRVEGTRPTAAALNASGGAVVGGENATYDRLEACEAGLGALGANRTEVALAAAADGDRNATLAFGLLAAAVAGVGLYGRRRL